MFEIWKRQFYATIEDDTAALRTREMIGEDTLKWVLTMRNTQPGRARRCDEMFEGFGVETRDKITRTNVAKLYPVTIFLLGAGV